MTALRVTKIAVKGNEREALTAVVNGFRSSACDNNSPTEIISHANNKKGTLSNRQILEVNTWGAESGRGGAAALSETM